MFRNYKFLLFPSHKHNSDKAALRGDETIGGKFKVLGKGSALINLTSA